MGLLVIEWVNDKYRKIALYKNVIETTPSNICGQSSIKNKFKTICLKLPNGTVFLMFLSVQQYEA